MNNNVYFISKEKREHILTRCAKTMRDLGVTDSELKKFR